MTATGHNTDPAQVAGMVTVTPEPTADELAAIISAHSQLWPVATAIGQRRDTRWKFSGRWWLDSSRPLNG